jgi:amphi-Trp domain-containing protein
MSISLVLAPVSSAMLHGANASLPTEVGTDEAVSTGLLEAWMRAHATLIRMSAVLPARTAAESLRAHFDRGSSAGGLPREGLELQVDLMELKEKVTLSREEAAARLHAIADELAANNDVVIERQDLRFVASVPDRVNLKVEFEIEDDGTELEIELTW